jgi:hypothetical protein
VKNIKALEILYVMMFSSGRTSAALAKYIKSNKNYKNVIYVFLNTGREREESLIFADRCDKEFNLNLIWLEAVINSGKGNVTGYKIVNFETASRNGEPFEEMMKKYPMPNNAGVMNCTRELKQRPIDAFLKEKASEFIFWKWILKFGNHIELTEQLVPETNLKSTSIFKNFKSEVNIEIKRIIGIRHDEAHRKSINAEAEGIVYPFCDEVPVDVRNIRKFWDSQPFDLELKDYEGNCDLCFKKSLKKRLTIIHENPKIAEWWKDMEEKYATEENPRFDLRTHASIAEQIELAKKPFTKAVDLHELSKLQSELFEIETDCFCKAT